MRSDSVRVFQSSAFARAYKKLRNAHKIAVDDAVQAILKDPEIGTQKRGDLRGVYVYKFKIGAQETLLAYEYDPNTRFLLLLGSHENFYRDLKRNTA